MAIIPPGRVSRHISSRSRAFRPAGANRNRVWTRSKVPSGSAVPQVGTGPPQGSRRWQAPHPVTKSRTPRSCRGSRSIPTTRPPGPTRACKRPEQAQRAESEVEATPARHRAKQVKPRLSLKLPHPRLEAELLKLGGGVGQLGSPAVRPWRRPPFVLSHKSTRGGRSVSPCACQGFPASATGKMCPVLA